MTRIEKGLYIAIMAGQCNIRADKGVVDMGIVSCNRCPKRFFICHALPFQDPGLAEEQGSWLDRLLVMEHSLGYEHEESVFLPSYPHWFWDEGSLSREATETR